MASSSYCQQQKEDTVFAIVEVLPEFPGGEKALSKFLSKNIVYPKQAKKNGIKGTVIVTFVIDKEGKVTKPRVVRDIGGGCGAEAIRVVKLMPNWKPGTQRGTPVSVTFNLPVRFKLDEQKKNSKK